MRCLTEVVPASLHLSDQGGVPFTHPCQREEACICVCSHTHIKQDSGLRQSHPSSSTKQGSKPSLMSSAAPPLDPGSQPGASSQLVLFKPPLGARPREEHPTPRASPTCSSHWSANLQSFPCGPPLPWGERGGVLSSKLAPTWRCGQKGLPLLAQNPCIIFCADFRQPREEDTVVLSK